MNTKNSIEADLTNNTVSDTKDTIFTKFFPSQSKDTVEKWVESALARLGFQENDIKDQDQNELEMRDAYCTANITDENILNNFSVPLYADVDINMPIFYKVQGNFLTQPIILKNLPVLFQDLPIQDVPKENIDNHIRNRVKQYFGLKDRQLDYLESICSQNLLRTGEELNLNDAFASDAILHTDFIGKKYESELKAPAKLELHKHQMEFHKFTDNDVLHKLKYRGAKIMPITRMKDDPNILKKDKSRIQPGRDILITARIYRAIPVTTRMEKRSDPVNRRLRRPTYTVNVVAVGSQPLTVLRDSIVCHNDASSRRDISDDLDCNEIPARKTFPSGFLFINNVFYVDERKGCSDLTEQVRVWAAQRGFGNFPRRSMDVPLQELTLRFGHPEVYVHQGNCEHMFTFSDVRLAGRSDPAPRAQYPLHTESMIRHLQYCAMCAEYPAKWVVRGSRRVIFEPGLFCDACLRMCLYKNGKKIEPQIEVFSFPNNEINPLRAAR
ncbi:hypothetical protein ACJJTC_016975 [Scirpophaga incertulas]